MKDFLVFKKKFLKNIPASFEEELLHDTKLQSEFEIGRKVELEHTDIQDLADIIAKHHLCFESRQYYTYLINMENSMPKVIDKSKSKEKSRLKRWPLPLNADSITQVPRNIVHIKIIDDLGSSDHKDLDQEEKKDENAKQWTLPLAIKAFTQDKEIIEPLIDLFSDYQSFMRIEKKKEILALDQLRAKLQANNFKFSMKEEGTLIDIMNYGKIWSSIPDSPFSQDQEKQDGQAKKNKKKDQEEDIEKEEHEIFENILSRIKKNNPKLIKKLNIDEMSPQDFFYKAEFSELRKKYMTKKEIEKLDLLWKEAEKQ